MKPLNRPLLGPILLAAGIAAVSLSGGVGFPAGSGGGIAGRIAAALAGWTAVCAGGFLIVGERRRRSPQGALARLNWEARDVAPWISLSYLLVFFMVAAPGFLRYATLLAVLKQGSAQAIVAAGLTFVLLCAEIDLAVGMLALWAACFCGWLFKVAAGPSGAGGGMVLLVLLLPLVSCLLLGLVSGTLTVWSRLPSFIITLAMMFIAEGMSKFLTQSEMLTLPDLLGALGNGEWEIGRALGLPRGIAYYLRAPYNAMLAAAVFLAGHLALQHTRFGRYVYMTGGNREAARLAGVRTGRVVVACLAISAAAAGLGGLVNAGRLTIVTVDQNKDLLLNAVACVVLGGTSLFGGEGSMGKTVLGVATFTVLNVGLMQIDWINDLARQLLTGVVLMAALVVNGVLAKRRL